MEQFKTPFVIWGSGGTAKKLFDVVEACGGEVVAIFDRDPAALSVLDGIPIYHGEEGLKEWLSRTGSDQPCNALVGAASAPGSERIELLTLLTRYGFLTPSISHPTAYSSPSAKISRGCVLFINAIVDAFSELGEACIINDGARVGHDCIVGNGVHVAPGGVLLGGSLIGDDVLIGANAVVLPGVKIGSNCVVGAGSVVLSDLPPDVVTAGNPAKILRTRSPKPYKGR